MTDAVIIWVWGVVFFFAAIPGALLGWIIGALFGSLIGTTASVGISVIAGVIAAEKIYPGSLKAMSAGTFYAYYYPMFFIPPFLATMLLGVWFSTFKTQ